MHERSTRAAVAGLVVLGAIGLGALAWAPRWTPPADADTATRRAYVVGIFEDPSARNPWAINGPNNTTWNNYVAGGVAPVLFSYTVKDDWIPHLAADLPSPLRFDAALQLWRSTLRLRSDQMWSDGTPITAHDVAFTFSAIAAFGATKLGGRFPTFAPEEVLARVDPLDDLTVEFFLRKRDARYRFGILTSLFMLQRGFWAPHVKAALASADPIKAILDVDIVDEPVAGAFLQGTWERGAFVDRPVNRRFTGKNATESLYTNGAVRRDDGAGHSWSGYGSPDGTPSVVVATGPHVDAVHYRVFGTQAAGVLALQSGQVSFLFNPLGLEKGFEDQLKSTAGVTLVRNTTNGIRFLGFNQRREPMRRLPFRQAVAMLIVATFYCGESLTAHRASYRIASRLLPSVGNRRGSRFRPAQEVVCCVEEVLDRVDVSIGCQFAEVLEHAFHAKCVQDVDLPERLFVASESLKRLRVWLTEEG